MKPLTDRQQAVLDFINQFIAENKYSPSMQEIGDHFGIKIKGVYDHLILIKKKGYISWKRKIARSITITEVSR